MTGRRLAAPGFVGSLLASLKVVGSDEQVTAKNIASIASKADGLHQLVANLNVVPPDDKSSYSHWALELCRP